MNSYTNTYNVNSCTNSYMNSYTKFQVYTHCPLTGPASQVAPAAPPLIFQEEDGPDADGDQGAPDPNDDADFGFGAAAAQAAAGAGPLDPCSLDPLTSFIKELGELSSMSGPDISAVIADLPVPQHGFIEGMSVEDAVKAGHLPVSASSDEDHLRAFTRSERILQDFQRLKRMSARDLKDLIQDVLKNPEFSIDEVDHNMHERLLRSIGDGDIEVLDMWQEGDGEQDVRFFKRKVETVLRELLSDERLEGCQHFGFKQYKNSKGERILGGHANGSVTFQVAQARVGQGKVPISIVLYIDATFIKRGIPIRPIYREFIYEFKYEFILE